MTAVAGTAPVERALRDDVLHLIQLLRLNVRQHQMLHHLLLVGNQYEAQRGDARKRSTFAATIHRMMAAGSLVYQRSTAGSPVLAAVQHRAQRVIRLVTGAGTERSPHRDATPAP